MENNDTFKMTYSAQQQAEIDKIRKKYIPQERSKLEQLRALDASVGKKAMAAALTVGILGALILGLGMSLTMTDFGLMLGLSQTVASYAGGAIGIVGLILAALAYPIYNRTLKRQRRKVAPEILRLTDELTK